MSLAEDLNAARGKSLKWGSLRRCTACTFLASDVQEETKMLVREAIRGTMGAEKLARIFANNDIQVGRTSIKAHREEGHS